MTKSYNYSPYFTQSKVLIFTIQSLQLLLVSDEYFGLHFMTLSDHNVLSAILGRHVPDVMGFSFWCKDKQYLNK